MKQSLSATESPDEQHQAQVHDAVVKWYADRMDILNISQIADRITHDQSSLRKVLIGKHRLPYDKVQALYALAVFIGGACKLPKQRKPRKR